MFSKAKFDHYKASYLETFNSYSYQQLYKWEAIRRFQDHWDREASNFITMFDKSIDESSHPWILDFLDNKKVMLEFIHLSEDMVRSIFNDLFDEKKELTGRLGRFDFHCNLLYTELQDKYPHISHLQHQNRKMASFYLAMRFPKRYSTWEPGAFIHIMKLLGAPAIPHEFDIIRYFKVMTIITKLLESDDDMENLLLEKLNENIHYQGTTLMLAEDFCLNFWNGQS